LFLLRLKTKMEALIINQAGCTIYNLNWNEKNLEKFKKQCWEFVYYEDSEGIIRFPETKDEQIKELQRDKFEELAEKGKTLNLTDLMINAGI